MNSRTANFVTGVLIFAAMASALAALTRAQPKAAAQQSIQSRNSLDSTGADRDASLRKSLLNWKPSPAETSKIINTEVLFYGKVVDQFGNPVPNAVIRYKRLPNGEGELPETIPFAELSVNEKGEFTLHGMRAATMSIHVVEAPGYYNNDGAFKTIQFAEPPASMPPVLRTTVVPAYKPDPQRPELFHMKKMGPTDGLYSLHHHCQMKPDGSPLNIFLDYNPESKGGGIHALEFALSCDLAATRRDGPTLVHSWRFTIAAKHGGLLSTTDDGGFLAPIDGYHPHESFEYSINLSDDDWRRRIDQIYFVRFDDGTYGRFKLQVGTYPSRLFVIESLYNPSGGRSVEWDTSKTLPLKQ